MENQFVAQICLSVFVLQVKVLFVRNLANGVTEEILETSFSQFGKLERVKKLKDYAFIHFEERDGAVKVCHFFPHWDINSESLFLGHFYWLVTVASLL